MRGVIFEYLTARRPILVGYDVVSEVLDETRAGTCCSTAEEIESMLIELYREYRTVGKVGYKGEEDKIKRYSQREMAQKFALVLDTVSS